jgi:hypothetical protein
MYRASTLGDATIARMAWMQARTAEAAALKQALKAQRKELALDTRLIAAQQRASRADEEAHRSNLQCEVLRSQADELRVQLQEEWTLRRPHGRSMWCTSSTATAGLAPWA